MLQQRGFIYTDFLSRQQRFAHSFARPRMVDKAGMTNHFEEYRDMIGELIGFWKVLETGKADGGHALMAISLITWYF